MNIVEQYYDSCTQDEWERLERHRTEFAVTLKALEHFLPPPPATVLDVGGGPGRYSIALASQGYDVTLLDLSQANLQFAAERSREAGVTLAGIHHGNALDLSFLPSGSFDVALLMGPLYHLVTLRERMQAILEARRVLHECGSLAATFVTRFAPFREAVARDLMDEYHKDPNHTRRLWETGVGSPAGAFPNAYFVFPEEVHLMMDSAGFDALALVGVEGVVAGHEDRVNALSGEDWEFWVEWNYRLGLEPSLLGASNHLLYIGTKPDEGTWRSP